MILLDTRIWLWWLHNPGRLSPKAIACIELAEAQKGLLVSAISVWEIAVKSSLGKLVLLLPVSDWFAQAVVHPGIVIQRELGELGSWGAGELFLRHFRWGLNPTMEPLGASGGFRHWLDYTSFRLAAVLERRDSHLLRAAPPAPPLPPLKNSFFG
jgi:hypothetical protein